MGSSGKKAGMKYAVLTAKHHDGFCLFDTKLTDYNSMNAACHKDLVKEFLEAFRAEGIKVGLYFSIIDWRHPDFPHYGDMHHPMRNHPECSNENRDFDRYLDFMFGQIKELLTNYGKLDLMWFDFSYGDMKCDKWKAQGADFHGSFHSAMADHRQPSGRKCRGFRFYPLQLIQRNIPAISPLRKQRTPPMGPRRGVGGWGRRGGPRPPNTKRRHAPADHPHKSTKSGPYGLGWV